MEERLIRSMKQAVAIKQGKLYHLVTHRFADKNGKLVTFGYEIMKNNKRFLSRKQLANLPPI